MDVLFLLLFETFPFGGTFKVSSSLGQCLRIDLTSSLRENGHISNMSYSGMLIIDFAPLRTNFLKM